MALAAHFHQLRLLDLKRLQASQHHTAYLLPAVMHDQHSGACFGCRDCEKEGGCAMLTSDANTRGDVVSCAGQARVLGPDGNARARLALRPDTHYAVLAASPCSSVNVTSSTRDA
jgi:hypothetical protein